MGTAFAPRRQMAEQAKPAMRPYTLQISALNCLTQAGFSWSPRLFFWKHEIQTSDHACVPREYVDYIVMEKVPGVRPPTYWDDWVSEEERAQLLVSFKEALLLVASPSPCCWCWLTFSANAWHAVESTKIEEFAISPGTGRSRNGKLIAYCPLFIVPSLQNWLYPVANTQSFTHYSYLIDWKVSNGGFSRACLERRRVFLLESGKWLKESICHSQNTFARAFGFQWLLFSLRCYIWYHLLGVDCDYVHVSNGFIHPIIWCMGCLVALYSVLLTATSIPDR